MYDLAVGPSLLAFTKGATIALLVRGNFSCRKKIATLYFDDFLLLKGGAPLAVPVQMEYP